jgi:hypothetical protein
MASFETIVRPAVFPNIRLQSPRVLPPDDSGSEGVVIRGNPGQSFELSYSYSFNGTSANNTETERDVDEARIYQQLDDGTVNRDNFVDVQVAKKIRKRGFNGDDWSSTEPESKSLPKQNTRWENKYKPVEEGKNIEIKERDKKIRNEET